MTNWQKHAALEDAIKRDLEDLTTRRVTLHRWLPFLASFGDYTPLKRSWENQLPQRVGGAISDLLRSNGELLIRVRNGFEIPRRAEHISSGLGLSSVRPVPGPGIKLAEVAGVQEVERISRDTSRVLPLLLLRDLDAVQTSGAIEPEATPIITVPDLAHYLEEEQVTIAASPKPSEQL